ncbi:nucleotidyltransferase domain-containing protein [Acetonema longum]|uniref:YcgL n=1 Tax=Acetonema longum DSM 6540 TaxID=1009370 RepID=F7NE49_9FIRM|nr:nucleotidyltransferase domain-containing protein [Acetonema longum]EGO65704.1 YcgL [Acetonema longum DSM 6540]
MKNEIMSKLKQMEQDHGVKILFAVESGSRGWGFASKDSDYDVRFVYVRPMDWYLSIEEREDFIEAPISDLLDINGWDLKKALLLYKKSNLPLFEWLCSPIVYREDFRTAQRLRELMPAYFAPVPAMYHYLHIAGNKRDEIADTDQVKIKKYFYILRPLLACMWIEKNNTMPPMEFSRLMADQPLDSSLTTEIHKLLEKKISGQEYDIEPKSPVILEFLNSRTEHFDQYLKTVRKGAEPDYTPLNSLFRETLQEVWG